MSAAAHEYQAAVIYLHGRGAHFALCRGKKPIWRKWQRRRPGVDLCLAHSPQLGLVPASIGTSALDIDCDEIGELVEAAPPLIQPEGRSRVIFGAPQKGPRAAN